MSIAFTGLYYSIMEKELDSKKLFTPQTAQSFKDKDIYEDLYGIPPSQVDRITCKQSMTLDGCLDTDLDNKKGGFVHRGRLWQACLADGDRARSEISLGDFFVV